MTRIELSGRTEIQRKYRIVPTKIIRNRRICYMIEKTIRDKSADERRAVRQGNSKPLVLALKTWLELQLARVSTKSVIAEVIRYGLNHWDGLVRFLDDGRIELDTNIVEPIVLNQKNALFAGHDQGRRTGQPSPHSSRPANCRRRSASLLRQRARQTRQSLASLEPRGAHALGVGRTAFRRSPSGITTSAVGSRSIRRKSSRQSSGIGRSLTLLP